jgi:hypothetical protein
VGAKPVGAKPVGIGPFDEAGTKMFIEELD